MADTKDETLDTTAEDEARLVEAIAEVERGEVVCQRIVLPMIVRQRPLRSWERPWEIEP